MGLFNKLKPSSNNNNQHQLVGGELSKLPKDWVPTSIEFTSASSTDGNNSEGQQQQKEQEKSNHDSSLGMGGFDNSQPFLSAIDDDNNNVQHHQSQSQNQSSNTNPFGLEYDNSDDNLLSNSNSMNINNNIDAQQPPPPHLLSSQQSNNMSSSFNNNNIIMMSEQERLVAATSKYNQKIGISGLQQQQQGSSTQQQRPMMSGLQQFEDTMKIYEEKLGNIDNTKFMDFNDIDTNGSSATPLSGIDEEESGRKSRSSNNRMRSRSNSFGNRMRSNNSRSSKGSKKKTKKKRFSLFGKKKKNNKEKKHQPVDSQSESDYSDGSYYSSYYSDEDEDGDSYISGEFDEEFDNSQGYTSSRIHHQQPTPHHHINSTSQDLVPTNKNGGIGVPSNGLNSQLTTSQLEDELYIYKLETLNLTDACTDLTNQLEQLEQKLESVQSQATFRIHTLESELQDGNIGMKSLVKMTSTEMDGRLDALRALGKTATIQANKLKERDSELILGKFYLPCFIFHMCM